MFGAVGVAWLRHARKVPWAGSAIFWVISHSSCLRSSKRGVALFGVVASGAHAFPSVTVVAREVSTSVLLEVRLVVGGPLVVTSGCVRR
jgi:hypothetical protein